MPRQKQLVTRDHQQKLSFTGAEHEVLQRRADQAGMRLFAYARAVLLNEEVRQAVTVSLSTHDRLVYHQWIRVGSNLNQLARRLNALESVSADEIAAVMRELRELIARTRA